MTESDVSDVGIRFAAEVDEAFNLSPPWSTNVGPIICPTTQSVGGNEEENSNEIFTSSYLPCRDGEQMITGANQQEQQSATHRHAWSAEDITRATISAAQKLSEGRRSFESESQLPLFDLHDAALDEAPSSTEDITHTARLSLCMWLPLTLRWPFMLALFMSALVLGVVAIVLSTYSAQYFGICDFNESIAFHFAWRFLPTMLAVLYALAITTLINDVKRTEAFAKLSASNGSSALSSLFVSGGYWWEDPLKAFSKKGNNGRRSWTLLWASVANIIAVLLVPPLSSGLLSMNEVQIPRRSDFLRLEIPSPLTPLNTITDETYFRTTSSLVQNLTTSAWLSETYATLPFWPADFDEVPFGASLAKADQQWQGQTAVFKAELQCISMGSIVKYYSPRGLGDYESITLTSLDGCKVELFVEGGNKAPSAGCWSKVGALDLPTPSPYTPPIINQSFTPECGEREVIFMMSPFSTMGPTPTNQTIQSIAQLCEPRYLVAYNVTTVVSDTPTGSLVSVDDKGFDGNKIDLNSSTFGLRSFETQFLDSKWATYYQSPVDNDNTTSNPSLGGPLVLLAATMVDPGSDFDPMFNATGLLDQARRVKQRFLGEALQAVFVSVGKENAQKIVAQVTDTKTRLLAGHWIGFTLGTPAVRGRLECTPYETLSNSSNWLQMWDLHNMSLWNVSANPNEPARGYELLPVISLPSNMQTTTFADHARLTCCANGTDKEPGLGSIGYWSKNGNLVPTDEPNAVGVTDNFTVKWIVGRPMRQQFLDSGNQPHFIWPESPSMTALNCQPIVETADATVTVDMISGAVQRYSIFDGPNVATSAWSDHYEIHNSTDPSSDNLYEGQVNVTVSYGALFMDALYNAARLGRIGDGLPDASDYGDEDLTDRTFNFRLRGLNVDYMSYTMFSLVQRKPQALLDHNTLQNAANEVFSSCFQHYASKNVTLVDGGRVFQPIGATLPFGLTPILNFSNDRASSYQDTDVHTVTNSTNEATVHQPTNELVMSPTAVFLCLAVLVFLACIAVLVYFPYAAYFKGLPRDVESLASIIALVYNSPKLRDWVAANEDKIFSSGRSATRRWRTYSSKHGNFGKLERNRSGAGNGQGEVTTGLGFFQGEKGVARWGVELEPVVHANPKHPYTALAASEDEQGSCSATEDL